MPPSGVDYASEFLNGYAPEYVINYIGFIKKQASMCQSIDYL